MLSGMALLSHEERAKVLSIAEQVALLPPKERRKLIGRMSEEKLREFVTCWTIWGRPGQLPPDGDWRVWLLMAGRGYGKTRAGAEWVHYLAEEEGRRIAIVGPTGDEARAVMIEGASGLLACAPPDMRPEWEPSLGLLTWPTGSQGFVFSGANPESLRGPEHDYAWCDELAKWGQAEAAWDNLMFGLRRGRYPRVLATTTPRPTPLMRRLRGRADVATTQGRTADNVLLAESFVDYVSALYGGTRLGRQELEGELIEDVEGALWTRDLIEFSRSDVRFQGPSGGRSSADISTEEMRRIVIGVDPPASAGGDACGIVAVGLGRDGVGYVLADHSVRGLSPEGWARAVAEAAERHGADRVVAEKNMGGDMVESVLRGAALRLPVTLVSASRGKTARAEPVAALFEKGRAKLAGAFPDLEDELAGLTVGGGYKGPGRSPDRADAMVWALTELMLGKGQAEPRVRVL
jgi:phage terminase large subunit-like protein